MKAILEIDAPESCSECVLEVPAYGYGFKWCCVQGLNSVTDCCTDIRATLCPLRFEEEGEATLVIGTEE